MGGPASNNPSGLLSLGARSRALRPFRTNPVEAPSPGKSRDIGSHFSTVTSRPLTGFQKPLSRHYVPLVSRVRGGREEREKKAKKESEVVRAMRLLLTRADADQHDQFLQLMQLNASAHLIHLIRFHKLLFTRVCLFA